MTDKYEDDLIECSFCRATIVDAPAAIGAGWYPCFWVGDADWAAPVCPRCLKDHFTWDGPDGDPILIPGHEWIMELIPAE